MNSEDLRDALREESAAQPPVTPGLRRGVDRNIRTRRLGVAALIAPAAAAVLAAVVLFPRVANETTVATSGGNTNGTGAGTTTGSGKTDSDGTTAPKGAVALQDPPPVSVPTSPSTSGPTATTGSTVASSGSCGTATITTSIDEKVVPAPFQCFIDAFNANGQAELTIVTTSPDGGAITEHLSTVPGHLVSVAAQGSLVSTLPAFKFAGGMSVPGVPGVVVPSDGNCGSITMKLPDPSTATPGGETHEGVSPSGVEPRVAMPSGPEFKAMQCMFAAFTRGVDAHVGIVVNDSKGGAMTVSISIGANQRITVGVNGSLSMQLPAGMKAPEDVLNSLPRAGAIGMTGMIPGLGKRTHKN